MVHTANFQALDSRELESVDGGGFWSNVVGAGVAAAGIGAAIVVFVGAAPVTIPAGLALAGGVAMADAGIVTTIAGAIGFASSN